MPRTPYKSLAPIQEDVDPARDPAKPFAHPPLERFAQIVAVQNRTQADAVRIAYPRAYTKNAAKVRGSELGGWPSLAARIAWLRSLPQPARTPGPDAPGLAAGRPPAPASVDETPETGPLTLDEARRRITQAVREAKTSLEISQALKLARDLLRLDDQDTTRAPDPARLVEYLLATAGRDPRDLAADAGGIRAALGRVLDLLRSPASEVLRALRAMVRELEAERDLTA